MHARRAACTTLHAGCTFPDMDTTTTPKRRSDLITAKQAAERLGCHPGTIRRWLHNGTLTRYTLPTGPTAYIDPVELDSLFIATPQPKP